MSEEIIDSADLASEKKVTHLNIVGPDGRTVHKNVPITPFAENVILKNPKDNTIAASLQEFLFNKFDDLTGTRLPDGQYEVNPSDRSIWQTWIDYQNMTKKRLMGLYQDGAYTADFIVEKENDIQAKYTITEGEATNIDLNISAIKALFDLKPKTKITITQTETGEVEVKEGISISAEDQARAIALHLGSASVWQSIIEEYRKQRDMLWGIYDENGEIKGHFEPTKEDLEALQNIYTDGDYRRDPKLLVDLTKKSVYQHLIDLQDFWVDLPTEDYNITTRSGTSIANKCDINSLHLNPQ